MATQTAAAERRVAGEVAVEDSALSDLGAELHAGVARAREEADGQQARAAASDTPASNLLLNSVCNFSRGHSMGRGSGYFWEGRFGCCFEC